ncbi:DNase I-like protein [Auricularia subglabra TFB-10046 SS5]|nr:DNase I-like protein [Auricularia subglabra TFB-10046 SS5]
MKWKKLAEDIRRQKIGVMAVQETHLSEGHVRDIEQFHPHLVVFNTELPSNPTGAGGVALVFNKYTTNYESVRTEVVIPGRVLFAKFEWHKGTWLRVLAVYASTDRTANHNMWEEIRTKLSAGGWALGLPDIVLGDFNFVEDPIDRFPAELCKMDNPAVFGNLRRLLKLKDGWRSVNSGSTEWTWRDASRAHLSRLDRIYLMDKLLARSRDWDKKLLVLLPPLGQRKSASASLCLLLLALPVPQGVQVVHLDLPGALWPSLGSPGWSQIWWPATACPASTGPQSLFWPPSWPPTLLWQPSPPF